MGIVDIIKESAVSRSFFFVFVGLIFASNAQGYDETKLIASDGAVSDYFGRSVAIDGDTAVVGAYSADNNGSNSGSVYVYTRNGSNWAETELSSSALPSDAFGYSVAIDGDTLVVGAPNGNAVYVYIRSGSVWSFQQKLTKSTGNFGVSVAVDGDTLIAGCYQEDTDTDGDGDGAAYIYTRSGTTWTSQKRLIAPSPSSDTASNYYGYSVAIDNGTVAVGAYRYSYSGVYSGSAYVYTGSGSSWTLQGDLGALASADLEAGDYFGWSVDVDGDTVLVGAYRDGGSASVGAAYSFVRNGSTWSKQQKIFASNAGSGGKYFGCSVSLLGDRAFIGAYYDDIGGVVLGSVYEFLRDGSVWSEENSFRASDVANVDLFGYSVAQTESFMIASSYKDHNENGSDAGAAYIYDMGYIPKTLNQFQINTYADNRQQEPAIASNSKDRYVVVWESRGQDGDLYGVYGQLYDKNGFRIGDEFQINVTTPSFQYHPDVSMNAKGDFVVVWQAIDSGGLYDIIARSFDLNGAPLTGEILVNTYTNSIQEQPSVSMNDSGDFVAVWASDKLTYLHARSICGRTFDAYGNPTSGEIVIADVSSDYPEVRLGQSGEFVVVWHNRNVSTDERNIFMRRYYSNVTPKGNAAIVNSSLMYAISEPKVDVKANGEIVVVWYHCLSNCTTSSIRCQHFNPDGSKLAGEYLIDNGTLISYTSSLCILDDGSITIAWETEEGLSGREIWARKFDNNGIAEGDQFHINRYNSDDQSSPDIASVGNRYFVVWESDGQDGSDTGVFGALGPATYLGDFDFSGQVDIADLLMLAWWWLSDEPVLDIAPEDGDGVINLLDYSKLFADGAYTWTSSADFDRSGKVDIHDLTKIAEGWLGNNVALDIAPNGGDGTVNLLDFSVLADQWQ